MTNDEYFDKVTTITTEMWGLYHNDKPLALSILRNLVNSYQHEVNNASYSMLYVHIFSAGENHDDIYSASKYFVEYTAACNLI